MTILHLPGDASNLILTTSSFSTSSSEDALLPWAHLKNPQGYFPGRFNVAAADDFIHADLGSSKAATFCMLFFHNLDDAITVELRRDGTGSTIVATMTKDDDAFYATFGSVSDQHWRLKFVGTNSKKIYLGKWVLGTHSTLLAVQRHGWGTRYKMDQVRAGVMPPRNQTKAPRRGVDLKFTATLAERDGILQMMRDCDWGAEPLVLVPDNTKPLVLYGRASGDFKYTKGPSDIFPITLKVEEDPTPTVVN